MGFKRPVYKLTFADTTPFAGLEVTVRAPSTALELRMVHLQKQMLAGDEAAIGEVLNSMAALIVAWNVEDDDDQPVPVTPETVLEQDAPMLRAIFDALREQVSGVAPPLPGGSGNGRGSLASLQIPVEPLTVTASRGN